MKFAITFISRWLWSCQYRTAMIIIFIAAGFTLFSAGMHIKVSLNRTTESGSDRRLIVLNGISPQLPLPINYTDKIRDLDGVSSVTHVTWLGAYFRNPGWTVPAIAVDQSSFLDLYPTIEVQNDQFLSWKLERNGVLVDRRFAQKYQLKIGDRLPLQSTVWSLQGVGLLDLRISGYVNDSNSKNLPGVFLHYEYLEKIRLVGKGLVSFFLVMPKRGYDDTSLARQIDSLFVSDALRGITKTSPFNIQLSIIMAQLFDFGNIIIYVACTLVLFLLIILATNFFLLGLGGMPYLIVLSKLGFTTSRLLITAIMTYVIIIFLGLLVGTLVDVILLQAIENYTSLTFGSFEFTSLSNIIVLFVSFVFCLATTVPIYGQISKGLERR